MDSVVLTVYQTPYPKIRLGKEYDGGYVICEIPNMKYDILLAGGIEEDISFEEAFCHKYMGTKCLAFDGTIDKLPKNTNQVEFIRKNIGHINNNEWTNLRDIIGNPSYKEIFVKMDIEGSEIPWIKSLSDDDMKKLTQIVMEFHFPFSETEMEVFQKINKHHYLVHFHGNNHAEVRIHNGITIPNVFECTYLHKKYFVTVPELNTEPIPTPIDMKNNAYMEEICINHRPFVNCEKLKVKRI